MPLSTSPARPAALLLDMDGTLTVPHLDFPRIKRDLGLPVDQPILEALDRLSIVDRRKADVILDGHENAAAEASKLAAGCHDLLDWLAAQDVPFGVVTRNSRRSLATVWRRHGLPACVCVTREDALYKPDPTPLRLACERLGVPPEAAWMVGDGPHDVEAGLAAGMATVWLRLNRGERPFAAQPWRTVEDLVELLDVLRSLPVRHPVHTTSGGNGCLVGSKGRNQGRD